MLSDFRTATMIPTRDIARARQWYEGVLGFTPAEVTPESAVYHSGGSQFNVYRTEAAGSAQHTLIGWLVADIERTVDDLTARGVGFERYDYPGLQTDAKGIAIMEKTEKGAWFKDPDGNILSLWQLSG